MNWGLFVFVILGPPIMTVAWAVVARMWAEGVNSIFGNSATEWERMKRRQRKELPWVLALLYVVGIIAAFQRHWH